MVNKTTKNYHVLFKQKQYTKNLQIGTEKTVHKIIKKYQKIGKIVGYKRLDIRP